MSTRERVFDLPSGWRTLRDRTWLLPATGHDVAAAERLDLAFDRIEAYLESVGFGSRPAWGLVTNPVTGRADAVMTVGLVELDDLTQSEAAHLYAATAGDAPVEAERAESIERQVQEGLCSTGPIVTIHDFVLDRRREVISDPALERGVVAVFPDGADVGYEFAIQTQDLTVFEDLVGYLVALAETVRPAEVSA